MNFASIGIGLAGVRHRNQALSIFIFHRVLSHRDPLAPYEPDVGWFDGLMQRLKGWFRVLPLDEAVDALRDGCLPPRAACITFDDGYADNLELACPVLKRHGLCATFFIATGYLDGGRMWNDSVIESVRRTQKSELDLGPEYGCGRLAVVGIEQKRAAIGTLLGAIKYRSPQERIELTEKVAAIAGVALPEDLMLRSEDVLTMRRMGMQIGAHTRLHPILAITGESEVETEIRASRDRLRDILGVPVDLFAYPNGKPGQDYAPKDVEIVRRLGFRAAVSTRPAVATGVDGPFELPRFTPWDQSYWMYAARMMKAIGSSAR